MAEHPPFSTFLGNALVKGTKLLCLLGFCYAVVSLIVLDQQSRWILLVGVVCALTLGILGCAAHTGVDRHNAPAQLGPKRRGSSIPETPQSFIGFLLLPQLRLIWSASLTAAALFVLMIGPKIGAWSLGATLLAMSLFVLGCARWWYDRMTK